MSDETKPARWRLDVRMPDGTGRKARYLMSRMEIGPTELVRRGIELLYQEFFRFEQVWLDVRRTKHDRPELAVQEEDEQ